VRCVSKRSASPGGAAGGGPDHTQSVRALIQSDDCSRGRGAGQGGEGTRHPTPPPAPCTRSPKSIVASVTQGARASSLSVSKDFEPFSPLLVSLVVPSRPLRLCRQRRPPPPPQTPPRAPPAPPAGRARELRPRGGGGAFPRGKTPSPTAGEEAQTRSRRPDAAIQAR